MATFTVSSSANYHDSAFSTRAGGDTYNISAGAVLTLDSDTRYGTNTSTTTGSAGNITISSSSGGKVLIDSSNVRLIPYDTGTGNVPAADTSIVQGGVSGKLIGVWSAINAAPTAAGSAMPASGYIKVRQKTGGNYSSGSLTNIGANATGADVQGWIEVSFDEEGTLTNPRLGEIESRGGWFLLGSTSGSRGQTIDLPTSGGSTFWLPGVYIETAASSGVYEFWPADNVNTNGGWNTTNKSTDGRSRYVQCLAGQIRIGSDGTNNLGELPGSGRNIAIPSNILVNNTTASRGATAVPNANMGTRYGIDTSSGGVVDLQYCIGAWEMNLQYSFSIDMSYVAMFDTWYFERIATTLNMNYCGNGLYSNLDAVPFTMKTCYGGGTIQNCVFGRGGVIGNADNSSLINYCIGHTFTNVRFYAATLRTGVTQYGLNIIYCNNLTFTTTQVTNGTYLGGLTNSTFTTFVALDREVGTTGTSNSQYAFTFDLLCMNVKVDGFSFGGYTNVHPYAGVFYFNGGSNNIKIRNIGTYATPLSLGSANATAYFITGASNASCYTVEFKRCYVINVRTKVLNLDASYYAFSFINLFCNYAGSPLFLINNAVERGVGYAVDITARSSIYGVHWADYFTSSTAGKVAIKMNEPTATTTSQVTITGGTPRFTSAGTIYMPTIGDTVQWETPEFIIGHTAFQNSALVMAGGTVGNYRFRYKININDGNGYSSWSAQKTAAELGTALNGVTLSATLGFKLILEIATTTANTSGVSSVYLLTDSTATTQAYQYPMEIVTLNVQNTVSGSQVYIYRNSDNYELLNKTSTGATVTGTCEYSADFNVTVVIRKPGYIEFIASGIVTSSGLTIIARQTVDGTY